MSDFKKYILSKPFNFESGASIFPFQIAYQTYGKYIPEKTPVIWVFHAISANANVLEWWPQLFGNNKIYDPNKYFIVCANSIGSPYGSNYPQNLDFPMFTIRDVVKAHQLLAEHLGIEHIHTAIGASFGGNQALEFAYSFQGKINHLVLIASSARESAWGIAIHETQRIAMKSDPTFGSKDGGGVGMKAARSIAMLTYRTSDAFIEQQTDQEDKLDDFRASAYIQYQGDKFVKRFDALCYYYLTKCLDSHHVGRDRGGIELALNQINIPTLIVGIKSDVLVPLQFQELMATHIPNAMFKAIDSEYGHDGFLVEGEKLNKCLECFYEHHKSFITIKRKVLKFGGSSLGNAKILKNVLEIILKESQSSSLAIIVSARGKSTDQLIRMYERAKDGSDYQEELNNFFNYQRSVIPELNLTTEFESLYAILNAVSCLQIHNASVRDQVVAFGELISTKVVAALLANMGKKAIAVDARKLIFTKMNAGAIEVDQLKSSRATASFFQTLAPDEIPVITGFIASDETGRTTTLGRNGSNFTATLIAGFIGAGEVQNWTDIDGIYSASPKYVPNAIRIKTMSYREANEMANFGTTILHPKTILPLLKNNIPLKIKSTLVPKAEGTIINKNGAAKGIKAVSVVEDVALISIEGKGLRGKVGMDGRIFHTLSKEDINVLMISQASSERGIGFVIHKKEAETVRLLLRKEFEEEIKYQEITGIEINKNIAIVAILGRHNYALEKAIRSLRKNKIWMHLISNSISGEHISLVVDNSDLKKAVRVVHHEVFGVIKTIHVFAFGKGNVGGTMLDQIIKTPDALSKERNLKIQVVGVADRGKYFFEPGGLTDSWRDQLQAGSPFVDRNTIFQKIKEAGIENVVIVDNTASASLVQDYPAMVKMGFDIVASNKKANSIDYDFYQRLRSLLKNKGRYFYYETNVGAGLPIIDTIKYLKQSFDKITAIRGVFSGSLSYLFNTFSKSNNSFSEILQEAKSLGLTEPDPREDLSGQDVARKLIILAREAGYSARFEEVKIENLIPDNLVELSSFEELMKRRYLLDEHFEKIKSALKKDEVLRYVGTLDVESRSLQVKLIKVEASSALGQIQQADVIFEIYTTSYRDQPIIVQGAGAGATVTARGVYSDILRLGQHL